MTSIQDYVDAFEGRSSIPFRMTAANEDLQERLIKTVGLLNQETDRLRAINVDVQRRLRIVGAAAITGHSLAALLLAARVLGW